MEVINALMRDMEECPSEIRICILDSEVLFENFDVVLIQHAGRNKNNEAHVLAKHGASCLSGINWTRNYSPWLQRVVDHDATNCNQKNNQ